jgi:hypothetical protein
LATPRLHPSGDLEGISLYIPAGTLRLPIHTAVLL